MGVIEPWLFRAAADHMASNKSRGATLTAIIASSELGPPEFEVHLTVPRTTAMVASKMASLTRPTLNLRLDDLRAGLRLFA